jgi:hypothetical protein
MEFAIVILLFTIGAVGGSLVTYACLSDRVDPDVLQVEDDRRQQMRVL